MKSFQQKLEKILREGNTDTKVLTEDLENSPCAVKPEHGEDVTHGVIDGTGKIDATGPVKHTGSSTLKTSPGDTTGGPTGHIPTNSDLPRPQKDGLGTSNGPGKNSLPPKAKYSLSEEEEEKKDMKEEKKELPPFMKKKHKEPDADNRGGKSDHDKDNLKEEEEEKRLKEEEEEESSKKLKEEEEESKKLKEEEEESKKLKEESEGAASMNKRAGYTAKSSGAGEKADKLKEDLDNEEGEKTKSSMKEEEEDAKADKKVVKEATKALFAGETISEVLKEKTATIFEATLSSRIKDYRKVLNDRYTKKLNSRVETIREELSESVSEHLDLVVEHWVKENEVPLERAIKAELVEEFIGGLKSLFEEHYIELPQEKIDVVSEMANRINKLETKLNEQIGTNAKLQKEVRLYERSEVFDKVSKNLAATQVEKLRSLSENVEFKTAKQFETAIKTLRENVEGSTLKTSNTEPKKTLTEQTLDQSTETLTPDMFGTVKDSLARMAKR